MDLSDFTLSVEQIRGEVNGKGFTTEMKTYSTELVVWNQKVNISFDPDEVDVSLADFISFLSAQANWIAENRQLIQESIVSELLELKNSEWLEDGQKPLSRKEFLEAIILTNIRFYAGSSLEMYLECGDLFCGHLIVVLVSKDRQIESVTIQG